jgi:hypothetical protein
MQWATALQSMGIASGDVLASKAKVMVAGSVDDICEKVSNSAT